MAKRAFRTAFDDMSQTRAPAAKKPTLTITLSPAPTPPAAFVPQRWALLRDAISCLHDARASATPLQSLYAACADLVQHHCAVFLFAQLRALRVAHVASLAAALPPLRLEEPALYLEHVLRAWATHEAVATWVRHVCLPLDRYYAARGVIADDDQMDVDENAATLPATPPNPLLVGAKPLWEVQVRWFATGVLLAEPVRTALTDALLAVVREERDGEVGRSEPGTAVSVLPLRTTLTVLRTCALYEELFEAPYLATTRSYYLSEASRLLALQPVFTLREYIAHVTKRIETEGARIESEAATCRAAVGIVEECLISEHLDALVQALGTLCDDGAVDSLMQLRALLGRIGVEHRLAEQWGAYCHAQGSEHLGQLDSEAGSVQPLIDLEARLDVVSEALKGDRFAHARKAALEKLLAPRGSLVAERLASFLDNHLRTGSLTEPEWDALLTRVMRVFRALSCKDVFEAFYRKDLARRLLLRKSAVQEREEQLVRDLRDECGAQYVSKIEGMFKDLAASQDVLTRYLAETSTELPVRVVVLSAGFWPPTPPLTLALPPPLVNEVARFTAFYTRAYAGRRLQWLHALAQCTVRAALVHGAKELVTSLAQCVLLLAFNGHETLTVAALASVTGLERTELLRTLRSLAHARMPLLSVNGALDADEASVSVNGAFRHKLRRLRINGAVQTAGPRGAQAQAEHAATSAEVARERMHVTDAAIVRLLKTRKSLAHGDLFAALATTLPFSVSAADVKKRIESLIERDYVARDPADAALYHYVA